MKKQFFLILLALSLACCKKEPTENPVPTLADPSSSAETKDPVRNECYQYTQDKDTVALSLVIQDNTVSGSLAYAYFEKDKSGGVVAGVVKGDTLLLDYAFMSEGTNSKRQVVFIRKDGGLTEGYGEVFEKDGALYYKNPAKLHFPGKIVLKKVVCTE